MACPYNMAMSDHRISGMAARRACSGPASGLLLVGAPFSVCRFSSGSAWLERSWQPGACAGSGGGAAGNGRGGQCMLHRTQILVVRDKLGNRNCLCCILRACRESQMSSMDQGQVTTADESESVWWGGTAARRRCWRRPPWWQPVGQRRDCLQVNSHCVLSPVVQ